MKKRIVIYLCLVQIFVVLILLRQLSKKSVLGAASISAIRRDQMIFDDSNFKYFFEPKPNKILPVAGGSITINNDRLNERFSYDINKKLGTTRVIALGDSWTYGYDVPTRYNWTEVLEDLIKLNCNKQSEIINLGMQGYDTAFEVERFAKRGEKYNPDVVLWLFVDLKRVTEKMLEALGENNFLNDSPDQAMLSFMHARENTISALGLENIYTYQKTALSKFDNYYKGKLLLIANPGTVNEREQNILTDYVKSRPETYYYVLSTKIKGSEDKVLPDGHPNVLGHDFIARELLGFLKSKKIISCN